MDPDVTTAPPGTVTELLAGRGGDDSVGFVHDERSWTWREVVATSRQYASVFADLRTDGPFHIGLLLDNTPEYLFALFGSALAGAVAVGLNHTRKGEELARDVRHTDCQLVLTSTGLGGDLLGIDLGSARVHHVDRAPWTARIDRASAAGAPVHGAAAAPDDLFVLIFTSGSTGAPKAVQLTHGRAARAAAAAGWLGADDVLYCAMPLFHGNALNAIVFPALATGSTIALRERFSASGFMPDVRRYGATFFSTVGRALAYVLATPVEPDERDHRVKFALAPESSPADIAAFRTRFGISCFTGYGSSENAVIFTPVPGMPSDALGAPQAGLDAAIVDPDTMVECERARFGAHGQLLNAQAAIGEIVGRNAAGRFEGYYKNPEADAARVRNGWYWSGDLGYRDGDDLFYFAGRSGDWLRVDSENFAAAPVERILGRFSAASGVVVFAVPDERTADDQVMAAIELHAGASFDPAGFEQFLADQPDLGTKWAPRYVRVTEALPVGATNKIDRRKLRAERWNTTDPVHWRPERSTSYRPFTARDLAELQERFRRFGRAIDRP